MAEIPIQLKFFKKLELYQELKFQNEKLEKSKRLKDWKIEKEILKWTTWNHHHLASAITHQYILENIFKKERTGLLKRMEKEKPELVTEESINYVFQKGIGSLTPVVGNLVQRRFAEYEQEGQPQIIFTPLGLLMGEVIYDCEKSKKWWSRNKYPVFIFLTRVAIVLGFVIAILTIANLLKNLFY